MADFSITDADFRVCEPSRTQSIDSGSQPGYPLRVMHVITYMGLGGTEQVVLNLLKGIGKDLFEQTICTTRGYDGQLACEHQLGGRLQSVGRSEVTFQFPLFRLARVMRLYRPHIVHTRNWGALEGVPAAKLAGVPVIIHSEHGYEMESLNGLPLRRRLFRRAAYGMADTLVTVSRELRDYHARQTWLKPERIRIIRNGVDANRFAARPAIRQRLRNDFGWTANSFVIGTVGRVVPIKDQRALFAAAERLILSGIDARVLLVGTGPELDRLRKDVEISGPLAGRAHFAGASDRVDELLNAMDVFVLPSLKEGTSNTLLEAMATNLPVIATRVGGNPEVLDNDRYGWLFAPRDISALAERLTQLAHSPAIRQALGSAARKRILDTFHMDLMTENYKRLYLETAALKGLGAGREATT